MFVPKLCVYLCICACVSAVLSGFQERELDPLELECVSHLELGSYEEQDTWP